ncbi:DUF3137 domain-containing protein [Hyphococcus sp.]|uniref:DUF3137 domain-containing protein n=1 Tax=Hyphococcus sp. TaxID=2038636 RepID=UPI002083DE2A|nr:MAG: hypothetical protein DHS20C04_29930 [Marinicaulis sp.]
MGFQAPSDREEFQGFAAYYESDIAPFLRKNEDARQSAVMQGGLIAIAAAVIAFAGFRFGPFGDGNIQLGVVLGALGLAAAAWRVNRTRSDITHGLLQLVCQRLSFDYRRAPGRSTYGGDFERLKLLPDYNRENWEDEVRGAREGAEFVLCEAHLKYKSGGKNSSTRTVFHGQLLVIDYRKEFLGETVVRRDAGMFNRFGKPGRGFQNVGITSPKFEKIFEAWSTDQVEARDLLDPLVLERFEELDRLFDGAKIRAAFSQGKLLVAMETGDKLNMGSMFKPLEGAERVERILAAFDCIFDLVDVLLKRVDWQMDSAFSVDAVRQVSE